jgi:hypothetical protein
VVACGALLDGDVTVLCPVPDEVPEGVLDEEPDDEPDEEPEEVRDEPLERDPSSPSPPSWEVACEVAPEPVEPPERWPDELVLCVWVVSPSPRAAPIALTTPRPARPAWRRRLRLMGVMPRRCVGFLCRTCERRGLTVSVS